LIAIQFEKDKQIGLPSYLALHFELKLVMTTLDILSIACPLVRRSRITNLPLSTRGFRPLFVGTTDEIAATPILEEHFVKVLDKAYEALSDNKEILTSELTRLRSRNDEIHMSDTWWKDPSELVQEQLDLLDIPLDEDILIKGPPGSGKTNLLLLRANYLCIGDKPNLNIVVFGSVLRNFMRIGGAQYKFPENKIVTHARLFRPNTSRT